MSVTKAVSHTPGPWHVSRDGNDVENVSGAGVCALYADETGEANARLIAAAPELLGALIQAQEAMVVRTNMGGGSKLMDKAIDAVNAAIAKATGQ